MRQGARPANWPRQRGGGYASAWPRHTWNSTPGLPGPLGSLLLEQERTIVAGSLECAFGLHCVQVGAWGEPDTFLSCARTRRTALVAGDSRPGVALVAEPSRAVAAVGQRGRHAPAAYARVRTRSARSAARGRARARREGELVVLGFEPLGTWALRNAFTRGGCPPGSPARSPAPQLADWLKLVGFEVGPAERYLYAPPLASLRTAKARGFLERLGRRAWPRASRAPTSCMLASACTR